MYKTSMIMNNNLRHIVFLLLSAWLIAMPCDSIAQTKKATTSKTQTTKKTTTKKTTSSKKTAKPAAQKKPLNRADYEVQQKEIQKRIKDTERMISDNSKSVLAQSRDIKLREEEIRHRRALLNAMQREIAALEQEEDSLTYHIDNLQRSMVAKKKKYTQAMRHLYRTRSGMEELTFVLSASNLLESFRRMRYLKQYSEWRKNEAEELEAQRLITEEAKIELSNARESRMKVMEGIERERALLAEKNEQQQVALRNLRSRGKELQSELEKKQKENREVQKKIQQMIEEERRKAEEARRKSETTAGQNKSKTTATSSPSKTSSSDVKLSGNFQSNKGRMLYPVDRNFAITRHFKEKNDGNVSVSLSTILDANACAIFDGTVLRVSRSSEDYTIIISHGEYMSVYSHLATATVREGQTVKARQAIGRIKEDIDERRGELMFWIYGKSEPENPEAWLMKP